MFCVHLLYFNLEYLSHLIFLLIPLWRGFYFSEDMLSDVHTIDVSYHRTRPWCPATCGAIADCLRILVALSLPCSRIAVALAGDVGICVCRLHPSNDRHFCLSPTCQKCHLATSATFSHVGQCFVCRRRARKTCCRHTFLHERRNQY